MIKEPIRKCANYTNRKKSNSSHLWVGHSLCVRRDIYSLSVSTFCAMCICRLFRSIKVLLKMKCFIFGHMC